MAPFAPPRPLLPSEEQASTAPLKVEQPDSRVKDLVIRFSNLNEFTAGPLMEQIKSNTRTTDLVAYAKAFLQFKPTTLVQKQFYEEALLFLIKPVIAEVAREMYTACLDDGKFCVQNLNKYQRWNSDCYSFLCVMLNWVKRYPHLTELPEAPSRLRHKPQSPPEIELDRGVRYSNHASIARGNSVSDIPALAEEFDLFALVHRFRKKELLNDTIQLQIGDWVMSDRSPWGHNHWAVFVPLPDPDKPDVFHSVFISRLSRAIVVQSANEFFSTSKRFIEIRRIGGPSSFQQHFEMRNAPTPDEPLALQVTQANGPEKFPELALTSAKKK